MPREKRPLQASFVGVAVYMMIALKMINAQTLSGATRLSGMVAVLPREIYPLPVAMLASAPQRSSWATPVCSRGRVAASIAACGCWR
jgi:hypothetical protein